MDQKLIEKALLEAFSFAAHQMGARIKGMSCFLAQWNTRQPVQNNHKEAA